MTPDNLKAALTTLLTGHLGAYTEAGFDRGPAIGVGEPKSTIRCLSGVEVRIEAAPGLDTVPLHTHTTWGEELPVRIIAHGSGSVTNAAAVVRRILSALPTVGSPVFVPANEQLDILAQYVLRVRSK